MISLLTVSRRAARATIYWLVIGFSVASLTWNGMVDPLRSKQFGQDLPYFYVAGQLWNEGLDPYDPTLFQPRYEEVVLARRAAVDAPPGEAPKQAGYVYPPPTAVLHSLLARLPYEAAYATMMAINLALLLICLWLLGLVLRRFRTICLAEIALVAALGNTGFARSDLKTGETSILACALVFATFILSSSKYRNWSGMVLGLVALKPSFVPFYLAYYAFKKSFLLTFTCIATGIALVLLPLLVTHRSITTTAIHYAQMLQRYLSNPAQDPSPFVANGVGLINLNPLVNRLLNTTSPATAVVSWMIVLVLCVFAVVLCLRSRSTPLNDLLDFSLVSVISLLAVTHRHYDHFLLFPGIMYLYVQAQSRTDENSRRRWLTFVVAIVVALVLPSDASVRISEGYPGVWDAYLWRLFAPFQSWAVLAVAGALFWLKARQALPFGVVRGGLEQATMASRPSESPSG